ncbi:DUF1240 domain-containing protein [Serratia fonticola]|uniref:DUF1240 domain-containing protein n=1 Tax=Serratia fonticola TaxID=47917 RepID=UPI00192BE773|nr:DUF1240 domain-containing protein [Serratia fonticola]MBL5861217.1 DUF1240 domain-containing protein [Serratia fonticola]
MDDVTRPLYSVFMGFLLLLVCWVCWLSLNSYIDFFRLSDVIVFSWRVGVIVFATPLLLYFLSVPLYFQLRGMPIKVNNKLFGRLAMLAMVGAVISLFFSFYVSYSLKTNGYKICPRKSWNAPTEYVRDMKLC